MSALSLLPARRWAARARPHLRSLVPHPGRPYIASDRDRAPVNVLVHVRVPRTPPRQPRLLRHHQRRVKLGAATEIISYECVIDASTVEAPAESLDDNIYLIDAIVQMCCLNLHLQRQGRRKKIGCVHTAERLAPARSCRYAQRPLPCSNTSAVADRTRCFTCACPVCGFV